jgi:hypothetical protein
MGIFMGLVDKYQTLNQEIDDGDKLTLFFGTIKFFNDNIPLKRDLRERIEAFFDFKWEFDRN